MTSVFTKFRARCKAASRRQKRTTESINFVTCGNCLIFPIECISISTSTQCTHRTLAYMRLHSSCISVSSFCCIKTLRHVCTVYTMKKRLANVMHTGYKHLLCSFIAYGSSAPIYSKPKTDNNKTKKKMTTTKRSLVYLPSFLLAARWIEKYNRILE